MPASKRCGGVVVGDRVLRHVLDHLAAAVNGGSARATSLAVEHADAGRAIELVAGDDVEIGVESAHVDRQMHGALRAVDQHRDAARMGDAR